MGLMLAELLLNGLFTSALVRLSALYLTPLFNSIDTLSLYAASIIIQLRLLPCSFLAIITPAIFLAIPLLISFTNLSYSVGSIAWPLLLVLTPSTALAPTNWIIQPIMTLLFIMIPFDIYYSLITVAMISFIQLVRFRSKNKLLFVGSILISIFMWMRLFSAPLLQQTTNSQLIYGKIQGSSWNALCYSKQHDAMILISDHSVIGGFYMTPDRDSIFEVFYMPELAISLLPHAKEKKALVMGLGAGTVIPTFLKVGYSVDVVDINPTVVEIFNKYIAKTPWNGLEIHVDDAMNFLMQQESSFDFISHDLFSAGRMPLSLFSIDFLRIASAKTRGIFTMVTG